MAPELLAAMLLASWTTSCSVPGVHTSWWAQMHCKNAYATSQWQCCLSWYALHCQLPAASWEIATVAGLNQVTAVMGCSRQPCKAWGNNPVHISKPSNTYMTMQQTCNHKYATIISMQSYYAQLANPVVPCWMPPNAPGGCQYIQCIYTMYAVRSLHKTNPRAFYSACKCV